ncbi:MAG: riboflavin synthase [Gammaproteobacteria bacterium]|nr:riboflavin synthase [Gammaproteobacteria bacterium]
MFTGLVQETGEIVSSETLQGDRRLQVRARMFAQQVPGESISVSGVCLTVLPQAAAGAGKPDLCAAFDVSMETLTHTTIGDLTPGSEVNLERALTPDSRLGGHFVSGHVDGAGEVLEVAPAARSTVVRFIVPPALHRYIARKGSICVEGVSLTVNNVHDDGFDVNLVPHTLQITTLRNLREAVRVNLEVDLIARYVERLVLYNDDVAKRLSGVCG